MQSTSTFTKDRQLDKDQLLARLQYIIKQVAWAEDKQALWLEKHSLLSWHEADNATLQAAIEYLEQFSKMFNSALDSVPRRPNNHTRAEINEAIRIYRGEAEEE